MSKRLSTPVPDVQLQPLSQRFPDMYADVEVETFVTPEMSLWHICEELRKLYARNCGFPHENNEWNPGRTTCAERGVDQDYNVACPHADVVKHIFRQAQLTAELVGKGEEGGRLYAEFRKEHYCIDTMDNSCRPLYQITIDGSIGTRNAELVEMYKTKLKGEGVCTDVCPGEGERFRESLSTKQGEHAERILKLRNEFLTLLDT
ncbi:hypothetical protein COU78_00200 [Candidatus Peregrinibacteria bacterium CG10_big_fil_rev_8_21_14_0_10_49_24]|nr:MAG: hypothetical protein COV83_06245 [Candidatus Peregrinibacteria bacterium CG11_big_fil_rev_8_21_14_0_20_49_14]PIR51610.1 MAG: hypothetical protein COU78_00200 [Candidatus Peregrinibacteria bacterium CG10_big_fil_rev_8_21_14_0_10_49_24]PJA68029.1 MAG: hypothetical protein CO157_01760 [Candidatus Peregrinibacteria bacterium CG_4_9_14_3_um_filter_49_12]